MASANSLSLIAQAETSDALALGGAVRARGGLKPTAGSGEAKALVAALSETERIELSRALATVVGAYQTNELVCQGLRHVFGVRDPETTTDDLTRMPAYASR